MKATKLGQKLDASESITRMPDFSRPHRTSIKTKRVSVNFPEWMVHSIDRYARRLRIPRESLIKTWLAERLEQR